MTNRLRILLISAVIIGVVSIVSISYIGQRSTPINLQQDSAIQQVHLQYNWAGMDGTRHDIYEVSCLNKETCSATGQKNYREWRENGKDITTTLSLRSIPYESVMALNTSLVNLIPANRPVFYDGNECMDHTDDYPGFDIEIVFVSGQLIKLASSCNTRIPWEVHLNEQIYIQKTGEILRAYRTLVKAIDPDYGR